MDKKTTKKRRRLRIRQYVVSWLLLVVMTVVFAVVLLRFPLIPKKFKYLAIGAVLALVLIFGLFSFRKTKKGNKTGISVLNTILAICLLFVSMFLPTLEGGIERVFADLPESNEVVMNVYALKTEYKSAHSEQFRAKGVSMITDTDIMNYRNKQFITQSSTDQDNQAWAIDEIKKLFESDTLWENRTASVWDAVTALYNADGDALVLNAAYADLIMEEGTYASFDEDTVILKTFRRSVEGNTEKKKLDGEKPFAVLIAGSDSREAALTPVTRTDVDIIAVVDPAENNILLVSLPRDTYMANPALGGGMDKLTHMGVYGVENTTAALSQFFDLDLDKYVLVNFNTYAKIVNTLNGVDISNPYTFNSGEYSFPAGNLHLTGEEALAYVRERKSLANGDFDRNEHQIIVLRAMLKKLLSVDTIGDLPNILDALQGTFLTNVDTRSLLEMVTDQIDSMGAWTINSRHVDGSTGSSECASMPGQLLSVVYADESVVSAIREEMTGILQTEE